MKKTEEPTKRTATHGDDDNKITASLQEKETPLSDCNVNKRRKVVDQVQVASPIMRQATRGSGGDNSHSLEAHSNRHDLSAIIQGNQPSNKNFQCNFK
mmetsp:Transcript_6864/g.10405  ORF Transcript_6864/g.10405 Transcript_6864/m.10405 type:complete len:98 (+) Transcript_6864:340-633(+)